MCKLAFVVACVLFGLKKFWGFELGNDFLFFLFFDSKLDLQKREKKERVYCGLMSLCCKGTVVFLVIYFVTTVSAFHTHHVITCGKFATVI